MDHWGAGIHDTCAFRLKQKTDRNIETTCFLLRGAGNDVARFWGGTTLFFGIWLARGCEITYRHFLSSVVKILFGELFSR